NAPKPPRTIRTPRRGSLLLPAGRWHREGNSRATSWRERNALLASRQPRGSRFICILPARRAPQSPAGSCSTESRAPAAFSSISSSRSAPPAASSPRSTSSAARSALGCVRRAKLDFVLVLAAACVQNAQHAPGALRHENVKELVARDEDDAACVNTN